MTAPVPRLSKVSCALMATPEYFAAPPVTTSARDALAAVCGFPPLFLHVRPYLRHHSARLDALDVHLIAAPDEVVALERADKLDRQ